MAGGTGGLEYQAAAVEHTPHVVEVFRECIDLLHCYPTVCHDIVEASHHLRFGGGRKVFQPETIADT